MARRPRGTTCCRPSAAENAADSEETVPAWLAFVLIAATAALVREYRPRLVQREGAFVHEDIAETGETFRGGAGNHLLRDEADVLGAPPVAELGSNDVRAEQRGDDLDGMAGGACERPQDRQLGVKR